MSNNRHSRSGHQVHPCWSGQARSSGARITKVALPLEKCLLVFIIDLQFLKASVGLRTFNQEGLQTNSLLREDLGLTGPMSSLQGEGLRPMPGWSHGPDGPHVRPPSGRPSGRTIRGSHIVMSMPRLMIIAYIRLDLVYCEPLEQGAI